jgi:hypothetical protein
MEYTGMASFCRVIANARRVLLYGRPMAAGLGVEPRSFNFEALNAEDFNGLVTGSVRNCAGAGRGTDLHDGD